MDHLQEFEPERPPTNPLLRSIFDEIEERRLKGDGFNNIRTSISRSHEFFERLGIDPNDVLKFSKNLYMTGVALPAKPLGENLIAQFL